MVLAAANPRNRGVAVCRTPWARGSCHGNRDPGGEATADLQLLAGSVATPPIAARCAMSAFGAGRATPTISSSGSAGWPIPCSRISFSDPLSYPWGFAALLAPVFMYWILVYVTGIPPLEAADAALARRSLSRLPVAHQPVLPAAAASLKAASAIGGTISIAVATKPDAGCPTSMAARRRYGCPAGACSSSSPQVLPGSAAAMRGINHARCRQRLTKHLLIRGPALTKSLFAAFT